MPLVGINPLPYFHSSWPVVDDSTQGKYNEYVRLLSDFTAWLIRNGYRVAFFHSQIGDEFLDDDILLQLRSNHGITTDERIIRFTANTFQEFIRQIQQMDFIVASRFHAVLFSYLAKKPVLGVSYHKKVDDLMEAFGQSRYTLQIADAQLGDLTSRFAELEKCVTEGEWKIDEKMLLSYRQMVKNQYDRVFAPALSAG